MKAAYLLAALLSFTAFASEPPLPPTPSRWVTDGAAFLSEGARERLDRTLEAYERQSGHQLLVWIGKTTQPLATEDWTVRAFKAWRVGRKGIDDGLILFVFSEDRKVRIEVGYGLEGAVPDARASRIILEVITPRIRAGDRDGAIEAGVAALAQSIGGPGMADQGRPVRRGAPISPIQGIALLVIALFVLGFLITHPSLAALLLVNILGGGRGGGWGGGDGGGGFSGGGGRSGGGGATGSW